MIDLPNKTFQWNTAWAGTYGERNKVWKYRSRDRKWGRILDQRKIVHLEILLGLFQECLNASFQFLRTKGCVVFRIGIPWNW